MKRLLRGRSTTCVIPPRRPARRGVLALAALLCAAQLSAQEKPSPSNAVVIPIEGMINDVLTRSIERRVEEARSEGVDLIIFEMNTKGGLVTSALDISKLIKKLPDEGISTVAWVNDEAYSAGALISVSAQRILMASGAAIGDCAPIMVSPVGGLEELGEAERAKAESPILQSFRDSAIRNDYDPLLCRAMVTVGTEVWWVENADTGERKFVDGQEKKALIDEADDDSPKWRVVKTYIDPISKKEISARSPVDAAGELLTLSEREALAYGFASGLASNLDRVVEQLGLTSTPRRIEASGWEAFATWLNSPLVRGILFVIVLLGGYIEFQSPGLVLPGVTALIALGIFLGAPYAAGLAGVWTIILLIVGLILLGLEILVIPGFGVAGVCGILLIVIAFVGSFVPTEPGAPPFAWPRLEGTWEAVKQGIIVLTSSVIIAISGIMLLAKFLPTLPIGRGLVLDDTGDAATLAVPVTHADVALVGDIGIVTGDLRPGGRVRFGQHVVDVQSQGEYVEAGRRVQVLERDGPHIVVRPLPDENTPPC